MSVQNNNNTNNKTNNINHKKPHEHHEKQENASNKNNQNNKNSNNNRNNKRNNIRSHSGSSRKSWPLVASCSAQSASFSEWAPNPCRAVASHHLGRRCCFFGHTPEEVTAASEVGRDYPVPCRDDAATAVGALATSGTDRCRNHDPDGSGSEGAQCGDSSSQSMNCWSSPSTGDKLNRDGHDKCPGGDGHVKLVEMMAVPPVTNEIVQSARLIPEERIHRGCFGTAVPRADCCGVQGASAEAGVEVHRAQGGSRDTRPWICVSLCLQSACKNELRITVRISVRLVMDKLWSKYFQPVPFERMQERFAEQIAESRVTLIIKEIVDGVQLLPQKQMDDVFKSTPQLRVSWSRSWM